MVFLSQSGITSLAADVTVSVVFALSTVACCVAAVVFLCRFVGDDKPVARTKTALAVILGAGFLLRLVLAFVIRGYREDYKIFADAVDRLGSHGLSGYYTGKASEVLYPVTYFVYIVFGGLANATTLSASAFGMQFAVKLPLVVADVFTAFGVYKIAAKYFNKRIALTLCAFVSACPIFFFGSAVWVTPVVLTACFFVYCCYFLARKNYAATIGFATAAAFASTEGIYIFPIVLVFCMFHFVRSLVNIKRARSASQEVDAADVRAAVSVPLAFVISLAAAYLVGLFMIYSYNYNPFVYIYEFLIAPLVGWSHFTYNGLSVYVLFNQNGGLPAVRFPSWVFVCVFAAIIFAVTCVVYFTRRNRATLVMLAAYALFTVQVYYPGSYAAGMQSVFAVLLAAYALVRDKRLLTVLFVSGLAYVINASAVLANAGYIGNLADYYFGSPEYTGSTLLGGGASAVAIICSVLAVLAHLYFTVVAVGVGMSGQKRELANAVGLKNSMREFVSIKKGN